MVLTAVKSCKTVAAVRCGRKGEDGVLTFAMAIRGDARFPWINPMTATSPVGAPSHCPHVQGDRNAPIASPVRSLHVAVSADERGALS